MNILDALVGKPIKTSDERAEQVGIQEGIPIFGLDALSSAAYGPEAALSLLIPLGLLGVQYIVPISVAIITLLVIVYFSYRQTIAAYPGGGGSYTVARFNLGAFPALLAAAALLTDYILTAAVGISAGVGALVSAVPSLQPHTVGICVFILLVITILNLRGLRDAGVAFMLPTYLFLGTLLITIGGGIVRVILSGGHPVPVAALPPAPAVSEAVTLWLLLRVFASGCTALTGVEAVSNGVRAFREPTTKNARITLSIIIGILILLLAGIAYLANVYHIGATDPGLPGYESVLSQMVAAVAGKGIFYLITIASILLVLCLSANTAFADFPRLCQIIALHKSLPSSFASRGRRLVFSQGIYVLTCLAGLLLIIFKGITDRLIPLYAVGAFLAFTLSQAGMVVHWKKLGGAGSARSMFLNGLGAIATLITVCVVLIAKFVEGAWITFLLIPALVVLMKAVTHHYARIGREIASNTPLDLGSRQPPIVILPIAAWNKLTKKALCFAFDLSTDIRVVHIQLAEHDGKDLEARWSEFVVEPARRAGVPAPQLELCPSPYRRIMTPIIDIAMRESRLQPDRQVAVVIPELVERRWYNYVLHNQRAAVLKAMLYFLGNKNVIVVNVPWYIEAGGKSSAAKSA